MHFFTACKLISQAKGCGDSSLQESLFTVAEAELIRASFSTSSLARQGGEEEKMKKDWKGRGIMDKWMKQTQLKTLGDNPGARGRNYSYEPFVGLTICANKLYPPTHPKKLMTEFQSIFSTTEYNS